MRRTVLCALLALLLLTTVVQAAALPAALENALPDGLLEATAGGSALSGGVEWLWATARDALGGILRGSVRNAALLTLAALICGAAEGLADGAGETAARYVPYCGVLAIAALTTGDLRALIGLGAETVDELGTLSRLLLPTLSAAMAAGGLVSTASVWQVTTLMACDLLSAAVSRLLLPMVYCYIAAAAAGAVLGEGRLDLLADGLKKLLPLRLTSWKSGDRIVPFGKQHPVLLKKLFADAGIGTAERSSYPVIRGSDGTILWAALLRNGNIATVTEKTGEVLRLFVIQKHLQHQR